VSNELLKQRKNQKKQKKDGKLKPNQPTGDLLMVKSFATSYNKKPVVADVQSKGVVASGGVKPFTGKQLNQIKVSQSNMISELQHFFS